MRIRLIAALLICLSMLGLPLVAGAQAAADFPDKPIHLVVPFPPGGTSDAAARMVAEKLRQSLKQPVLVENRAGVGGTVGSEYVARSKPDGYTLVWGSVSTHAIVLVSNMKTGYDMGSFDPVIELMEQPLLVVVPASAPVKSFQDLVARGRGQAQGLTYGSAGVGTTGHLTGLALGEKFGVKMTPVPYKGSAPMLTDLAGAQIDVGVDNFPAPFPMVKGGRLRALAVTSKARSPLLPEVPALGELMDGYAIQSWQGIFAPKGTPEPVLDKLFTAFRDAMADPEIVKSLQSTGTSPAVSASRKEFADFVAGELVRWKPVANGVDFNAAR